MDALVKRGHESLLNRRDGSSVRADVKQYVLSRYQMEKLSKDGWEYPLTIPYVTDEELASSFMMSVIESRFLKRLATPQDLGSYFPLRIVQVM